MITGKDLRMAFCMTNADKLVGYDRSAQVKFFSFDKTNGKI
jgi:hypothetical protein